MSLLEVRDLRVTYGGVVAVRDVSFAVAPGEVLAVLGANGAGKTTTLMAVSGLVRARDGDVLLDGPQPPADGATTRSPGSGSRTCRPAAGSSPA